MQDQNQNPCPPGYKFHGYDEKTGWPWCQAPHPPGWWVGEIGSWVEKNIVIVVVALIGLLVILLSGGGKGRRR